MLKTKDWSRIIKSYNPTINCPCSKLNASWTLPRGCLLTWVSYTQDKSIDYKVMLKNLPNSVAGYVQEGDPEGMNMNGMSCSTAAKEYAKGDQSLKVTIIDHKGAISMYSGFTMAGDMHMENESSIANSIEIDGHKGMETYDKEDKSSTLLLGVHDRYYVTIALDDNLDEVKRVAKALKLSSLPK